MYIAESKRELVRCAEYLSSDLKRQTLTELEQTISGSSVEYQVGSITDRAFTLLDDTKVTVLMMKGEDQVSHYTEGDNY